MISKELIGLLLKVLTSWQVIAVTIAIILYVMLVSFAAKMYRRPRFVSGAPAKPKKKKAKHKDAMLSDEGAGPGDTANDELGLEEE